MDEKKEKEPIKELDLVIKGRGEVNGYTFTQIDRSPYAYIYESRDAYGVVVYEVFRRKVNYQFNCVSYPKCSGFGDSIYMGKIFSSLSKAREYFKKLNDYCVN